VMAQDIILVKNLYKIYGPNPEGAISLIKKGSPKERIREKTGNIVGVNNGSFKVKKGEIFVIMGLSGSGKSTLLRCVNRLVKPTCGKIIVGKIDVTAANKKALLQFRRKETAMVFQDFALFPHMSVIENVKYGLDVQNVKKGEKNTKSE